MALVDFYRKAKKKISDIGDGAIDALGNTTSKISRIGKSAADSASELMRSRPVERYFEPAPELRTRDFVREASHNVGEMFSGTKNVLSKAPKVIGEGAAFAVDKNVRKQYKAGNTDILPTVTDLTPKKMLADTAKSVIEIAPFGKIKATAKMLMSPSVVKRVAGGAGLGYAYDVADKMSKEEKTNADTFKPGMGTALGGVVSGLMRPTTILAKEGIDDATGAAKKVKEIMESVPEAAKNSIRNRTQPLKTERLQSHWSDGGVVRFASDADGKPGVIPKLGEGERYSGKAFKAGFDKVSQSPVYGIRKEKLIPEQVVERKASPTLSDVGRAVRDALPQPGMSLKNVGRPPRNQNTLEANALNARKNAAAKETVRNLMETSPGAPVAPRMVPSPQKAPQSAPMSIDERISKELDAIPDPAKPMAPVKPAEPLFPSGGYNKYQKDAFNKRKQIIQDLREIANVPDVLRAMGYKKAEAAKIGVEEGKIIAELGRLGYPKGHQSMMDFRSDMTKNILKNRVAYQTLKEYYARKRDLNTKIMEGIDPVKLKDISALQAGTRDVYRNFEDVFGDSYGKVKSELLDPFDASKGAFIDEQRMQLEALQKHIVDGLGIKKGSRLSQAVQQYGDTGLPDGMRMSYDDLVKEFGKDGADKVVRADQWFRNMYDNMLDETNRIREFYFPTHPLHPESTKVIPKRENYYRHFQEMADGFKGLMNIFDTPANIDPALAVSSQFTKPSSKWISFAQKRTGKQTEMDAVGGFLDYIKANAYAKHIDPHIQRFRGVDQEIKSKTPRGAFFDDTSVGLAEELSKKMDPFESIASVSDPNEIKNLLIGKGLQDRDAVRMAKDLAGIKDAGKVKEYMTENLSPEGMAEFNAKALAEASDNKLNNFLKFLDNFSNDLAGKTNPIDRPFQDNMFGRQAFKAINWLNSRVKANTIVGNASSALAQFFGIPNGIANAGVRNSARAIGHSMVDILKDDVPSKRSVFLNERYFNGYDKFEPGILNRTKDFAVWITSIGDKIGSTFTWNAQYQKALGLGVSDPVKYADDWTRKLVAGRGIGEVPILQKSKITQLIAPFQLEVANQWRVFGDWAKNDPSKLVLAKRLMEFSVATWLMNRAAEEIRGSGVAIDPIQAMIDAYGAYSESDTVGTGLTRAGGRIAGEALSNLPLGQTVAAMYPEYGKKDIMGSGINLPTREKLFGDKDPTRFGGGLLVSKSFADPLFMVAPPFGGKQIKNSIEGVGTLMDGFAETSSGKVMTPVESSPYNMAKGLFFGKNSLQEVQDYREADSNPLGDTQDEIFRMLPEGERGGYYSSLMASRSANKEKEGLKAGGSLKQGEAGDVGEGVYRLKDGKYFVPALRSDTKTFKNETLARQAIEREDFEDSDESFRDAGDYVLRKKDDGTAYQERKDSFTVKLLNARMSGNKRAKNFQEWRDNAEKKYMLLQKLVSDPTVDDLDRSEYENQIDTLANEAEKFESYGGAFNKPKAEKKLPEKFRYPLIDKDMIDLELALMDSKAAPISRRGMMSFRPARIKKVRKIRR